jgi:3'(2'), 5'-bisphosphate nucleotidase
MQDSLLKAVCECAVEAGRLLLNFYTSKIYTVVKKHDNTPQTQADWEAHVLIENKLAALSSFPIISEESYLESTELAQEGLFWLVDPMDGTKEFLNRSGDFTVNIGLIEGAYPIMGVVYVPVTQELFYATHKQGAYKITKDGSKTRIHTHPTDEASLRFLISRKKQEEIDAIRQHWPHAHITRMGSSLKYCRIAEGKADIYIRRMTTYEWDTAAAQCILEEAGGKLCNFSGQRLHYRKDSLKNESIVAFATAQLHDNFMKSHRSFLKETKTKH